MDDIFHIVKNHTALNSAGQKLLCVKFDKQQADQYLKTKSR
jgi:hypothetical protein